MFLVKYILINIMFYLTHFKFYLANITFVGSFLYNFYYNPDLHNIIQLSFIPSAVIIVLGVLGGLIFRIAEKYSYNNIVEPVVDNSIWSWFPIIVSFYFALNYLGGFISGFLLYKILKAAFLA